MGLFSNGYCPIHGIEYKIGSTWEGYYKYCPKCVAKLRQERKDKESMEQRIRDLERKISAIDQTN